MILAVGTELSETDSFVDRLALGGRLVRVDIDPRKLNDFYPAEVAVLGDAAAALEALVGALGEAAPARDGAALAARTRQAIEDELAPFERSHLRFLRALREALPADAVLFGDACQPGYTATFAWPADRPRRWHYAAGFLTLGPGTARRDRRQVRPARTRPSRR